MKNILPILADVANGVFAVVIAAMVYDVDIQWWYFVVGILCAMSPDIDAIPELLSRGKVSASAEYASDHRTFLHYPLVSLPLGILVTFFFGFWGFLWLVALTLHLINDLYGTGWGLQLAWPFSHTRYKVLARRVNWLKLPLLSDPRYKDLPESERRLRVVVSWKHDEFDSYMRTWGEDDWISNWYLRLNIVSCIEYGLFAVACVMVFLTLR
jgi:LexA-binding, inner membrane-associated putative hydrolase